MTDIISPRWRRVVYIAAVFANTVAIVAKGLGYISDGDLTSIVSGLSILCGGLALGYVPRKTALEIVADSVER